MNVPEIVIDLPLEKNIIVATLQQNLQQNEKQGLFTVSPVNTELSEVVVRKPQQNCNKE